MQSSATIDQKAVKMGIGTKGKKIKETLACVGNHVQTGRRDKTENRRLTEGKAKAVTDKQA